MSKKKKNPQKVQYPISPDLIEKTLDQITDCMYEVVADRPLDYQGIDVAEPMRHIYSVYLENEGQDRDHDKSQLYRLARIAFSLGICQGYAIHKEEIQPHIDMVKSAAKTITGDQGEHESTIRFIVSLLDTV